ncbi:MAG: glycerol-3-phosphate dehydrogenase/oxidase [Myxococcaceae bacterium]
MDRAQNLDRLSEGFDVAIIGGGATGLGAAVESASRGYRTVLFEAHDFAKGTSSRSTKLVHGGVRYLAQGNVGLVREALRERGRLRRNAPHLVGDLRFIVPAYAWWSGPYYGVGLKLYDLLAGRFRLGSSRSLDREAVLAALPNLEPEQLKGGILYIDGQFDDARLAVTLALTANDLGATLLNQAAVTGLLKRDGRLQGVVVHDAESGLEHAVRAKVVVNATGVFADQVRHLDNPGAGRSVSPSQGIHLVLPESFLPGTHALVVPKTDDGRVLFIIPWHGRTVVGTTDTPVEQPVEEPRPLPEEVAFLLEHAARYLVKDPARSDVLSVYAGLRPLVRPPDEEGERTASLSRDHHVFTSASGLVTIVGGKWTTYRKMAEDVITRAGEVAGLDAVPSRTAELRLHGAPEAAATSEVGVPTGPLASYGTEASGVRALAASHPELSGLLHPRLPYLRAEVAWGARHEMARTVEDVLARRTRALLLDARASLECAPVVARLLARELGRDEAWQSSQVAAYRRLADAALL